MARPRSEWLGLAAGLLFALGNVLVRRLQELGDVEKSLVIWAGVTLAAAIHLPAGGLALQGAWALGVEEGATIAGIAAALVGMGLALQYGLTRLPANRAIVILLSELVVAAIAAYYLAGETLRLQDWIGGALIVAATSRAASLRASPRGRVRLRGREVAIIITSSEGPRLAMCSWKTAASARSGRPAVRP